MFPKLTNGRVSPQLTNILLAYTNPEFYAERVIPTVPNLKEESGKIPQLGVSHLRVYSTKRALYDESSHRMNYTIDNSSEYQIDYYDLEGYVPDRLQEQLQSPFDAKKVAAMSVYDALRLERENALAALMTNTAVLTNNTTLSGTSQYDDQVNSTPETDFDTARTTIFNAIGREPNTVLMNRTVANALRRHPYFTERSVGLTGGGRPQVLAMDSFVEIFKQEFEVSEVIIAKAIRVSSKEGQTVTKTQVWGNDVVFFYRAPRPSLMVPSFGYSFQLAGKNLRADERRHSNDLGDIVRSMWAYQDKILDVNAAYLIKGAV